MAGFERQMMEAGCNVFMTKPVDIDALVGTMAQLLGGERIAAAPATAPAALPASPPVGAAAPIVSRLAGHVRLKPTIRKFVGRLRERLIEIDDAMQKRDAELVASFAHWLKGSAGSVGYDAFTEPAMHLEQAAKSGEMDEAARLLKELRALTARIVTPGEETAPA